MSLNFVRLRAAAAGALIALAAGLLAASPAFDALRGVSIDVLTLLRTLTFGDPHPASASPTVVVALDEETFRTTPFEGSPSVTWTPEIGRVLNAVIAGGSKVVGFDVVFATSIEQSAVPGVYVQATAVNNLIRTDGVTEAENWETAQFGMERLEAAVLATLGEPARRVVEEVIARVTAFAGGAPQSDDITCLAVVRGGVGAGERG